MPVIIDGTNGITQAGEFNSDSSFGFKNRLINGQMTFDQRNAGASVTPTGDIYTLDRWQAVISQTSKFSVQQNAGSITPPAGFQNYLGVTSLSSYSVISSDYFLVRQAIEGYNAADLDFGANAKTITVSFWVRSSLTGTFGASIQNSNFTRSYPFNYTVSTANTWEQKTVTIAGDTSGTWLKTNGIGIYLSFGLGMGSTYSGTANTWAGANYVSTTGATSVVGTNGATFYITGVQLEVGSTATSFDYRSIGTELQLCQRYTQVRRGGEGSNSAITFCGVGNARTSATWYGSDKLSVTMRTFPSLTVTNPTSFQLYNTSGIATTTISIDISDRDYMLAGAAVASGLTTSQFYTFTTTNSNGLLVYSAEL